MASACAVNRNLVGVQRGNSGFTLVEIIVSLTVVSVALSIFISMFIAAIRLAGEGRNYTIAAELAEAELAVLVSNPGRYVWAEPADARGAFFEVVPSQPGNAAEAGLTIPETVLATRDSQERNENLYKKFAFKLWAKQGSRESDAYEVTASVYWKSQGRPRSYSLTSSLPKSRIVSDAATSKKGGTE